MQKNTPASRVPIRTIYWIIGTLAVLLLGSLCSMPLFFQVFFNPSEAMEPTLIKQDRIVVNKQRYRLNAPAFNDVILFHAPSAATGGKTDILFVKRIIGLPGDRIQVTPPELYVDGKKISTGEDGMPLHDYLRAQLGLGEGDALLLQNDGILVNGKTRISLTELAAKLGKPKAKVTLVPGKTWRNGVVLAEPFIKEDPDYAFPQDGVVSTVPKDEYFVLGDNRNRSADSHYWGTLRRDAVIGQIVSIVYPSERAGPVR